MNYPHISDYVQREQANAALERELLATLHSAGERHGDRHERLMELLDVDDPKDINWEAWDKLNALQDADYAIINGAQKQLTAIRQLTEMGHGPA